jgi:threonine dehydrogenase-like Zn-dependent dehydrogenase
MRDAAGRQVQDGRDVIIKVIACAICGSHLHV